MVDRRNRSSVASFFFEAPCAAGETVELAGDALAHAHVRRIEAGDAVRLVNGQGSVATGSVVAATKRMITVSVESVEQLPRPSALEVLVPVADRDRMLMAAEKCVELQVTAWRPVMWARSQSVAGGGAGERFAERVLSRMRSALEQSGGAWLPAMHPQLGARDALRSVPLMHARFLLDAGGPPLAASAPNGAAALAVGPEGGLEAAERDDALASGWVPASIGSSVLRFETAIIAGAAVLRAQHSTGST
jgi:16S rRNA (uracil1498-N3)-methyltransferase